MADRTLVVPVEEAVRELDAKLLLASLAIERGFQVFIGRRDVAEQSVASLPPGLFLGMDLRSPKTFERARLLGFQVAGWDEEAVVHYPAPVYRTRRIDPAALSHISALMSWGPDNTELWKDNPIISRNAHIFETGNPRGDLLRPEFWPLYDARVDELKAKYGAFILVNTNFGSINNINPILNLFVEDQDGKPVQGKGSTGMPLAFAKGLYEHRKRLFAAFPEMICAVARAVSGRATVIVRPHPMENWDTYRYLQNEQPNVRVVHEGSVLPWLRAASVVIHNGCNTAIESYYLGGVPLAFQPVREAQYDSELPNEISHSFSRQDDLIGAVNDALDGCLPRPQSGDRDAILAQFITAREGPLAAERIVDALTAIEASGARPGIADRSIARLILRDRKARRSGDAVQATIRQRFGAVNTAFVTGRLQQIRRVLGRTDEVRVEPAGEALFRLKPSQKAAQVSMHGQIQPLRNEEFVATGLLKYPLRRVRMSMLRRYAIANVREWVQERVPGCEQFSSPAPPVGRGSTAWKSSAFSSTGPAHLAVLGRSYLNKYGGVFHARGRVIHGATHKYDPAKKYHIFINGRDSAAETLLRPVRRWDRPLVALAASTHDFYFHWMMEILPRIAIARRSAAFDEADLYVTQRLPFQQQTLALLGIESSRIVDPASTPVVEAPSCIAPAFQIMPGGTYPDWLVQFLRQSFLQSRPPVAAKRIYLSRLGAAHRRVVNEDEIVHSLSAMGFQRIALEEMDVEQQIQTVASADTIVSPHGGGLTNIAFARPGTLVVELFPDNTVDLYYRLAVAAKLRYAYVTGFVPNAKNAADLQCNSVAPESKGRKFKLPLGDYVVRPADVVDAVSKMLWGNETVVA